MSPDVSPQPSDSPAEAPDERVGLRGARTIRPGSSIAVGVIGAVAGLALLVPALLTEPRSWTLISSLVLALVLLWLFVVRPAAVIHDEGIRLVNPLRVVDVTWPTITEVRSKWALELVADGKKYTAWGIPADPGRPKYGRSLLTAPANRMAKASSLTASGRAASAGESEGGGDTSGLTDRLSHA